MACSPCRACAPKMFTRPSDPGVPAPDAAAIWSAATAECRKVQTDAPTLRCGGRENQRARPHHRAERDPARSATITASRLHAARHERRVPCCCSGRQLGLRSRSGARRRHRRRARRPANRPVGAAVGDHRLRDAASRRSCAPCGTDSCSPSHTASRGRVSRRATRPLARRRRRSRRGCASTIRPTPARGRSDIVIAPPQGRGRRQSPDSQSLDRLPRHLPGSSSSAIRRGTRRRSRSTSSQARWRK